MARVDIDDELVNEESRMENLRQIVDFTTYLLSTVPLPESETQSLIENCRRRALELFPDKAEVFDLIYPARFRRAREQAWDEFDDRAEPEWPLDPSEPM
jgi:hypothetical protein